MESKIEHKKTKQKREKLYLSKDVEIASEFAKQVHKELSGMVTAVILFGSAFRKKSPKKSYDVDVMIILDDVRISMSADVVQTYRIIIQKIISEVAPKRLHVQILHLSAWWGYVRAGDPVAINVLRDGIALVDTGWFDPLQALLDEGKIRPSEEAVWTYMNMAEASLYRSENHLVNAAMDLYWAVIDAAHAALMSANIVPTNPKNVADTLREVFVGKRELDEKHARTMDLFYSVSKEIVHKKLQKVEPKDFKKYKELASEFVKAAKKIVRQNSEAVIRKPR